MVYSSFKAILPMIIFTQRIHSSNVHILVRTWTQSDAKFLENLE